MKASNYKIVFTFLLSLVYSLAIAQAPTINDAEWFDTDNDGNIDRVTLTFSAIVDIIDGGAAGDGFDAILVKSGAGTHTLDNQAVAASSNSLTLDFTGDQITGTGITGLSVEYDDLGALNDPAIIDQVGPDEMADATTESADTDSAAPVVSDLQIEDTNEDGLIDQVVITFSENIDTDNGNAPVTGDVGTIKLPDNTTASGFANGDITDPAGTSATVTVSNITSQATINTAVGSSGINGIDGKWEDNANNAITATGDDNEAITDAAAPIVADLQIEDTDSDGLIDKVVVTWSENIDTDDGAAPIVADMGTITLPDGNTAGGFSNGDITDPAGSSATVTVVNITGQSTINTGVGSSDIDGLAGLWEDVVGNPVTATGDDSETITDAAAPIMVDLTISADNATATLVFSEGVGRNATATDNVREPEEYVITVSSTPAEINNKSDSHSGGTTTATIGITYTTPADGTENLIATVNGANQIYDTSGNAMADGESISVGLNDKTPPVVTIDNLLTNDPSPQLTGTVDDNGATIQVTVNAQGPYSATNNMDGTWTLADNTITPDLAENTYDVTVTATDGNSNVGTDGTTDELEIDLSAPTGYTIAIQNLRNGYINATESSIFEFKFTSAEVDAIYNYSIDDVTGPAGPLVGNGTITTAGQTIGPIDISALLDENITVTVTLTDPAGNTGSPTNDSAIKDATLPTFLSLVINSTDNTDVTLNFSEPVYENNNETGNLTEPNEYTVSISGGSAVINTITDSHTAGNTYADLTISYNTIADGTDLLVVTEGDDIFDKARNKMVNNESISTPMNDNTIPIITNLTISGDNTNATVTFSEGVYATTGATGNLIEVTDLTASLNGTGCNCLSGYTVSHTAGDPSASITLTYSGTPDGSEVLTVNPADGAAIYDGGNNPMAASQSNNTVSLNDQLAPSGYSVTWDTPPNKVNFTNETDVTFTITGAEVGTTLFYSINDVSMTGPVTGNVVVGSTTEMIDDNIDVSALNDETLTLTVYLQDAATNQGGNVTDNIDKDTGPPVYNTGPDIIDVVEPQGSAPYTGASFTVDFDADEPGTFYWVIIDNNQPQNGSVTYSPTSQEIVNAVDMAQSTLDGGTISSRGKFTFPSGGHTEVVPQSPITGNQLFDYDIYTVAVGDPIDWSGAIQALPTNFADVESLSTKITQVYSDETETLFGIDDIIAIKLDFEGNVDVDITGGVPRIELDVGTTGRFASYVSGTGTSTLTFNFDVDPGDVASDLNHFNGDNIDLNGGTIFDAGTSTPTSLALPSNGSGNTLAENEAIVVDGITPTLDPAVATPNSGTSIVGETIVIDIEGYETGLSLEVVPNALVNGVDVSASLSVAGTVYSFDYLISEADPDQLANALPITITLEDAAGNTSTVTSFSGGTPAIDANTPTIASVTSDATSGSTLIIGQTITFTVTPNITEPGLTVAPTTYNGGTLTWSTADAGATYTATYSVDEGHTDQPTPLQLTGVTLSDPAGNTTSPSVDGSDVARGIDANRPTLSPVHIESNNPINTDFANTGNMVSISFTSNEPLQLGSITPVIKSGTVVVTDPSPSITNPSANNYLVTYVVDALDTEGDVSFTLDFLDAAGNSGVQVPGVSDGSNVEIDNSNPDYLSFTPANVSINIPTNPSSPDLTITFDEPVQKGLSSLFFNLFLSDGTPVQSVDVLSGDVGIVTDIVSINLPAVLAESTDFYVTVDAASIIDRAGNPFAGISTNSTWTFTTFGSPTINSIQNSACIGELITIGGRFFTGVDRIRFNGAAGELGLDLNVISDIQLEIRVPAQGVDGPLYFEKDPDGDNPNRDVALDNIILGPRAAVLTQFDGSSIQDICDAGTSTVTNTTIKVDITGGTGPYNVIVTDGNDDYLVGGYTSGNVIDIPITTVADLEIEPATNPFTIVSVEDANNCFVVGSKDMSGGTYQGYGTPDGNYPDELSGSYVITVWERSVVDPGPDQEVCVAVDSQIQLAGAITGSVTTGTWTTNGSGTFVDTGTGSSNLLNAVYDIELADITLGQLDFTLTSTTPVGSNPCAAVQDIVTVVFTATKTANAGPDVDICSSDPSVQLNGSVGGGSTTGSWIIVPDGVIDGSFDDPNILNPVYTMSPEEQTVGSVTLRLTTTDGTCGPDASDEMILSIGPNPTISKNIGPESVCVNTTFVTYSVNGPSTNTYDWSLPANATLVSGDATKSIIVDWGSSDGLSPITVEEQGEGIGCFSNIVTFNVMVNPLPTPVFIEPTNRSFSTSDPNIHLSGGPDLLTPEDGVFSGPGVIFNSVLDRYEFDAEVAGVTPTGPPAVPHDIVFTYTDANGCTNTKTEEFTVFDASSSIVVLDEFDVEIGVLQAEYCEDYGPLKIKVSDNFPPAGGFVFDSFIEENGLIDNGDGTAIYDPGLAANVSGGGPKIIRYLQRATFPPFFVIPFGSQVTTVNLLPQLAPNPIPLFYCSNDAPVSLIRDVGINPENTFSFSIPAGDPNILIENPSTGVYDFIPGKEIFTANDYSPHVYTIEYYYLDDKGCDDTFQFDVTIYQRPPQPVSPDVSACIGQALPSLTVEDPVPGANIRWYDNAALTGVPFVGTIFNPVITQDVTLFYVTQEINGCTSLSEEVKVERFPLPVVDMTGFDNPAEYCVDGSSFLLNLTPTTGGVFSGDIDGVVDNGDGTFSFDPLLAAGGDLGILDPLDLSITYSFSIAATGCTDQVVQDITINPINFVQILNLQDNQEFCVDDTDYTLTPNISTGSEGTGTFTGDGIVSGNVFRASAAGVGTHPITYSFTNNNGCVDFQTLNVIVNPLPIPSFTTGTKCASLDVQFTSTTPGNIVQWNWEFNDDNATGSTNTSDLENPTHAFSLAGTYNVQLTVIDDKGCQASVTNVVTVGENPSPSFDFEALAEQKNSWFLNTTPTLVNSTLTKETWTIEEWDGTDLDVIVVDPALIGTQQDYVFVGPGRKKVTLEVETDKGCVASITKELFIVPFIQVAASTNYSENFDNSDGGWVSWGFDTPNNEWSLGTATGLFEDASMGDTWYTQPDNDADDISFVYSPCFDITALTRPVVTLNTFTDTKNGAIIQYSTDGRFGEWNTLGSKESGIIWYNTEIEQQLQSIPGNPVGYGWKIENSGWNESRHSLGSITQGRDNLVFRIVFKGIQGDPATQGFAFDNFRIDDRDRIVLVEHFENATTSNLVNLQAINDFGKDDNDNLNTSELVKIQYRTGFGGSDNLYDENRADVNARALFYDVTTANRAMIDGDNSESDIFLNWGQTMFGTKSLISPDIEFENIDISQRPSGQVDVQVALKAKVDVNGRFLTQVAIVEDQVSSNGYEYVMRKMLPDAAGTISNGLAKDAQLTLPIVTWDNPFAEDFDNLYVIVFSQMVNEDNAGVKKVMQTTIEPLVIDGNKVITGISTEISRNLLLYPNPASETVNVVFTTFEEKTVRVFDQFGKMVHDKDLDQGVRFYQFETDKFASGVYFIQIESNRNELIREKFILSH